MVLINPLLGSSLSPLEEYNPLVASQRAVSDFDPGSSLPMASLPVNPNSAPAAPSAPEPVPLPSPQAAPPGSPGRPRWGPAVTGIHVVGGAGAQPAAGQNILNQLIAHAASRGHNLLSPSTPQETQGRGLLGGLSNFLGLGSHTDQFGNTIQGGHITWPAGFGPNKGISAFGFTDENGDYHTNMHWDRNTGTYMVGAHRVYTSNARLTPDGDVVYVDAQGNLGSAPQDSPDVIAARAAERAQERYPPSWQSGIGIGTRFIPTGPSADDIASMNNVPF